MFRQQLARASKASNMIRSSVRFNSTNSAAENASSKVSGAVNMLNCVVSKTVFWGKVVGELSKQVYIKEGMAPPSSAQVKAVFELLQSQATAFVKHPEQAFNTIKDNAVPYAITFGVGAVQVVGLFSLGEIIGRRKIVGYSHH